MIFHSSISLPGVFRVPPAVHLRSLSADRWGSSFRRESGDASTSCGQRVVAMFWDGHEAIWCRRWRESFILYGMTQWANTSPTFLPSFVLCLFDTNDKITSWLAFTSKRLHFLWATKDWRYKDIEITWNNTSRHLALRRCAKATCWTNGVVRWGCQQVNVTRCFLTSFDSSGM